MPKGNAAKIIARDLRKHGKERQKRLKTKSNKHKNQHEFLRVSNRKALSSKHQIDENDLLGFSDGEESSQDGGEAQKETVTSAVYNQLMNDKDFLLSFQPKKIEDVSDDEVETEAEQKLGSMDGPSSSQVVLSETQKSIITDSILVE